MPNLPACVPPSPRRRGRPKGPKSPTRRLTLKSHPLIVARGLGKINFPLSPFSSRKRIEAHVRKARPIRANYELGTAVQHTRQQQGGTTFTAMDEPSYIKPADARFIHDDVGHFLEAYKVLSLEKRFLAMGIYTYEDLITIAVDIRGDQSLRKEFRAGVEASDDDWRRLKRGIYRYARPIRENTESAQADGTDIPVVAAEEAWDVGRGLFVMGRLTFDPCLLRFNGDKYFFDEHCPHETAGEPYERAQRIIGRFTATLPAFIPPPGSDSAMEHDLVDAFTSCRGAYLLPRLQKCGVMSLAHFGGVWRLCRNTMFAGYFRMAIAMSVAGKNWNVLKRMGMRLTDPDDPDWGEEVMRLHRVDVQKSKEEATAFLISCQDIMAELGHRDPVRRVISYDESSAAQEAEVVEAAASLRLDSDEEEDVPALIIHRTDGEMCERMWAPR
ncbi:hypothetical protein BDZ89DRAFT_1050950 [Hymenopellis radicata]|nr:hypothetical protein BDZ89DRAFT_1050950 [Hymenopellis radicata]